MQIKEDSLFVKVSDVRTSVKDFKEWKMCKRKLKTWFEGLNTNFRLGLIHLIEYKFKHCF